MEIDSLPIGFNHVVGNQRSFATAVSITVIDIHSFVHGIYGVFRNLVTRYNRRSAGVNINTNATMVTCNRIAADLDAIYIIDIQTIILSNGGVVGNFKLAVIGGTTA